MQKYFLLLFPLFMLFSKNVSATHVVAADLTYECLGNNQYEFTLTVYRDCEGIATDPSYEIEYQSVECVNQGKFRLYLDEGPVEVSPVCPAEPSTCQGGTSPGIEKYVYKGRITLPAACSDWEFSWVHNNRNAAITNIENPDSKSIRIAATLNNIVAPCNNSPVFNNEPVAFININQNNRINPGAVESDGHKVEYHSVIPQVSGNENVQYKSGFSASSPLSTNGGFSVDHDNGSIDVNPSGEEVTVVAILVEEYNEDNIKIGSVVRDIQIIAQDVTNANPEVSGFNGTDEKKITICANQTHELYFDATDSDADQSIYNMAWNYGISGANFWHVKKPSDGSATGYLRWRPTNADAGTHTFTVSASDDFCPITGQTAESYTIEVIPSPEIELGNDRNIPCGTPYTLDPDPEDKTIDYTYEWNTGETSPAIEAGTGAYSVTVTGENGCSVTDQILLKNGVVADPITTFDPRNYIEFQYCTGQPHQFRDSSSSEGGSLVEWHWDFGVPDTEDDVSTDNEPLYTYSEPGTYDVTLTVRDDNNCEATTTERIEVCAPPTADFSFGDSCQAPKNLPLLDNSKSNGCGIESIRVYANGISIGGATNLENYVPETDPKITSHVQFPDTGWVNVRYVVVNKNYCTSSIEKPYHINWAPQMHFKEDPYYFECNNPDSVINIKVDTARSPYELTWGDGSHGESMSVNMAVTYRVEILDSIGCYNYEEFTIKEPLKAKTDPGFVCIRADSMQFSDSTFSHWGIKEWEWDFGDGDVLVTGDESERHPKHWYSDIGDYQVKLIVTDSSDCVDSTEVSYLHRYPDESFSINKDTLCDNETITYESRNFFQIDTMYWDLGDYNGLKLYPPNPNFREDDEGRSYTNMSHRYSLTDTTLYITNRTVYNNERCEITDTDSVYIYPDLEATFDVEGQCSGESTTFESVQTSGNPITSWKWTIDWMPRVGHVHEWEKRDSSDKSSFTKVFKEDGTYRIGLTIKNTDECQEYYTDNSFDVITMPDPGVCPDMPCATRQTKFFYLCSDFPEVTIDSIHWEFGDPGSGPLNTTTNREPFHIYEEAGDYDVTVELFNNAYGCKSDTTVNVKIYPLPLADFAFKDTVCLGQSLQFEDKSVPGEGDEVEYWVWNFGDGDSSGVASPAHLYSEVGEYEVTLNVSDEISGCESDTYSDRVHVYPVPEAGFYTVENELVKSVPVTFYDESKDAVQWLWKFGDGDSLWVASPPSLDPEHTYPEDIREVTIMEQVVYNEVGCTDTATQKLDLDIYFMLPSGFSPNGDGNNDYFQPTYKGIQNLLEFKVYNRWGEVVYEQQDIDLNSGWDGTYNGKDQPVGVYVYYVKALNLLQEEVVLSGNVSLIR